MSDLISIGLAWGLQRIHAEPPQTELIGAAAFPPSSYRLTSVATFQLQFCTIFL